MRGFSLKTKKRMTICISVIVLLVVVKVVWVLCATNDIGSFGTEKNGKLCIIESKKIMTYESFVRSLSAYKVTHALYLDMGSGWNYAWYCSNGKIVELHSKTHNFCTNWITFYK